MILKNNLIFLCYIKNYFNNNRYDLIVPKNMFLFRTKPFLEQKSRELITALINLFL